MEISILNHPYQINESSNRHRLIDLISSIVHQPPLGKPHQPPINFEVSFYEPAKHRFRKHRNYRSNERNQNYDSLNNQAANSVWRLTFPTVEFGQSFLDFIHQSSLHDLGFSEKVKFVQASYKVAGGPEKIQLPNSQLIYRLKTTEFKSPLEERELEEELKNLSHQIFLASIEYGRLTNEEQCPSVSFDDASFRSEYQELFQTPLRHLGTRPLNNSGLRQRLPQATIHVDSSSAQVIIQRHNKTCDDYFTVIHSKTITRIENGSPSVLIFLESPPTFHSSPRIDGFDSLFSLSQASQLVKSRRTGFDEDHQRIIPFTSHLIRLNFPSARECQNFITQTRLLARPRIVSYQRFVNQTAVYTAANLAQLNEINARLDLAVSFQLDTLLYNLLLNPLQIIQLSRWVSDMEPSLAERVLIRLASDLSNGQVEPAETSTSNTTTTPSSDVRLARKFNLALTNVNSKGRTTLERRGHRGGLFQCRTVTITPTTFIFEGPLPEQSNSILRLYDFNSAFIRVAIRDESGANYQHDREVDGRGFLRQRYLPILYDGLIVAGRKFEFLGYSSSALKCHQAWFVCPFTHMGELLTASKIRDRMGSFSKVNKIPARYMARIAQAFTTTEKAVTLLPSQLMLIDDVQRNGSVFTDGVGTISPPLAKQVEQSLLGAMMILRRKNAVNSSCYQIRLGGFKGMISIDCTLPGEIVRLRPSMSKFDAQSYTLDIASSFRRPLPAFLNRPLIKILEDLKVPPHLFMKAQFKTVNMIENSRTSFRKSAKLMDKAGIGLSSDFPKILKRFSSLMRTDNADQINSTFIHDCLDLVVIECLRDLKYRARIPLDNSYTLVGVADEDHCLREGEIYACIKDKKHKKKKYLRGPVAISRSPCIHPGDVQVVNAIGEPPAASQRLGELANCVVFSVLGQRSLPSCLGGGDLDGDLYTLIQHPGMIPLKSNIQNPGSYPPPQMKTLDQPCTIRDGVEFFLDYISSDLVGMIASRHLHIADYTTKGTLHPDCLKLAELHSKAVDYPKTGVPVSIQDLPKVAEITRPDFMCPEFMMGPNKKGNGNYYESTKVLGRLFRAIPSERVEFFETGPLNGQLPQSIPGRSRRSQTQQVEALDADRRITRQIINSLRVRNMTDFPDPIWGQEFKQLLETFSQEFLKICQQNSLNKSKSDRKNSMISEMEGFIGVILTSTSDRRLKKETLVRLQDQTLELFQSLRHEIIGEIEDIYDDDDDDDDDLTIDGLSLSELSLSHTPNKTLVARALAGWYAAVQAKQNLFGTHSFGLICLQLLCSELRI